MDKMKNFQGKKLSRDEAKNVLGGLRNPADDCPGGTHEYTCVMSAPGESGIGGGQVLYLKYCVPDGQQNPPCSGLN
jgi:hypothetical protein